MAQNPRLPELLRQHMQRLGLSQSELARRSGVHQTSISTYLKGTKPTTDKLAALATALEVSVDELLTGKAPPEPPPPVGVLVAQRLNDFMGRARMDVAALAKASGVRETNIRRYLSGHIQPGRRSAERMADALDAPWNAFTPASVTELPARPLKAIPVVAVTAAGQAIDGEPSKEAIRSLTFGDLFRGDDVVAMRVKGKSMLGIGILSGDWVVIRRAPMAASGEVVVVSTEDGLTLKRLEMRETAEGDLEWWLLPFSDHAVARRLDPDELPSIVGVYIGVVRKATTARPGSLDG